MNRLDKFRFYFRCWRSNAEFAEYDAKVDIIANDPDQARDRAYEILKSYTAIDKHSWHLQRMEVIEVIEEETQRG